MTDEAAPAVEHHVWGGSLWLWHQWRRRWKTPAGKLPGLSLWLRRSSRDSLPHPEWQDHTQSRNPRSPNICIMFDSIHKQLSWFSSARNMSHGKYSRENSPLCWNCVRLFECLKVSVWNDAQSEAVAHYSLKLYFLRALWKSDIRMSDERPYLAWFGY